MVRQAYRVVIMLAVLVFAALYLSPAYAQAPPGVPHDTAGQHLVKVEAGTPVTVLGLHREPANPNCEPPTLYACQAHTYAILLLPNGKAVALDQEAVTFRTQTIRVGGLAFGPLPPEEVNRSLGLSDTGGVASLPLLGAVMLIGSGFVVQRMLTNQKSQ